jgi:hypothetical protein
MVEDLASRDHNTLWTCASDVPAEDNSVLVCALDAEDGLDGSPWAALDIYLLECQQMELTDKATEKAFG